MAYDTHSLFGYSRVSNVVSQDATEVILDVDTGDGARFATGQQVTIWPQNTSLPLYSNAMVGRVTAVATDRLTVNVTSGNQEGSQTVTVTSSYQICNSITPKALTDIESDLSSASYVLLGSRTNLSTARVLTGTTNQVNLTDNGAGSTIVLSLPQNIHTAATPTFAGLTIGVMDFSGAGSTGAINVTTGNQITLGVNGLVGLTVDSSRNVIANNNARIADYLRVGSTSAPTNTTAGDLTATRLSVGNTALGATTGSIISISGTSTSATGAQYFTAAVHTITPTVNGDSSQDFRAFYFMNIINPSAGITISNVTGGRYENRTNSTGNISNLYGLQSIGMINDGNSPATTSATTVIALGAQVAGRSSTSIATTSTIGTGIVLDTSTGLNGGGITYTDFKHIRIQNVSALSVTTQVGIDVESLTRGTTDIGIRIAKADTYSLQLSDTSNSSAGGIWWGTDTNLYRIAADVLATDDSARIGGYLRVGSTSVPNNTTAGDITGSRINIGTNVNALGSAVVRFQASMTDESGTQIAVDNKVFLGPAATSSAQVRAYNMSLETTTGVTFNNATGLHGGWIEVRHSGGGSVTQMTGMRLTGALIASNFTAGTITRLYGMFLSIGGVLSGTPTGTVSTATGIYINPFGAGTGPITVTTQVGIDIPTGFTAAATNIGVRIAAPSGGATANYALQLSDTGNGANGGITFGTDTTLYRSAANTLKTDDSFHIGADLSHLGSNVGFFGVTPTTRQTELTDELTTITHSAPVTPDYAIADPTQTSPYGFTTLDEALTVLSVIANLQTRVNELETKLTAYGLLIDAD